MPDFEVTFESTPKGTPLRKASDKVCMPRCVQVLKERSKTSTMHLGLFGPPDIVDRVEGWRQKAADERTRRNGKQVFRGSWRDDKPVEMMIGDDVDSTKLTKTCEV